MFDHTTRLYLPAEQLLRDRGVKAVIASQVSRKAAGEEGSTAGDQLRAKQQLERAYHPHEGEGVERERRPVMVAHQIMSAPVMTLHPRATLAEARALFRERRFRHVPILSPENRLVGIISDRDLLRHAEAESDGPITPMISERVFAAAPGTEIREIARSMFEHHIGAMPVIDPEGHLEGIITRSDILRTLIHRAPLELWV